MTFPPNVPNHRNRKATMKRIRLALAAVLIVLAGVGGSLAPSQTAAAGYWYEYVPGPITGEGLTLSEGACIGNDPHWLAQWWNGWTCPSSKGRVMLKWCEINPWLWQWEIQIRIADAQIHWDIYGNKWFNRTTGWRNYLVDRRPAAQAYCMGPHPSYF